MFRPFLRRLAGVLVLALPASTAHGFNPPVDRAGPLVVRVEGPKLIAKADAPVPVVVVVENSGDQVVQGTVNVAVIDRWSARPDQPAAFTVAAKATTRVEFTVTPSASSYDALYPIHAFARFSAGGRDYTAHPILIVPVKLGAAPRVRPEVAWAPFAIAENSEVGLWQLPARRGILQVFGRAAVALAQGQPGDESTGASTNIRPQDLDGERRETVAIHPPWRDGQVGTAAVEFPIMLPANGPIRLRFQNAVVPEGKGDGVTFRVRVAPIDAPAGQFGEVVYERHTAAKHWGDAGDADLSRFAGRSVRIQLESHPGPKNDTGWDQSFWSEPTLVAGSPPAPPAFPPRSDAGSLVLGTTRCGNATAEVRLWPGSRGLLDSVVGLSCGGATVHLRGFEVRVLGSRLDDPRSPIGLVAAKVERTATEYRVRHTFRGPEGTFDLVGTLVVDGVLHARFRLDDVPAPKPWRVVYLEDVALGPWSRPVRQLYAGFGNVIRDPGPFTLGFDGHQLSTSFIGLDFPGGLSVVQGVDVPPDSFQVRPAARHYSIHAPHSLTFTLIPARNAFDAARCWHDVNGLKPAGGVTTAAGRFVFDLWGGRYAANEKGLKRAFRYGLDNAMVVYHDWQRWGYDYRLPDIYPPSPVPGTEAELKALIATCKAAQTRIAVHDNYIDFYPDAEGFSYEKNIAFDAAGNPVRAWLNDGRDAQSYRYRPDRAEPFLKRNLALIRQNLAPTAYFIDVWSSIGPYDYWTADGQFGDRVSGRTTWGSLFAWIRDTLGDNAPQISESGHDQLIGWLDGAQTNHLRVGKPMPGPQGWTLWNWPCADAERTPWYDTAHHDRFVLHGAGYPGRYEGGLDAREHGIYSDDYIATEVLTGHPAMVSHPFGLDVVRKHWLLNDLLRALALQRITSVEYAGDDLHRQHVRWSGGGEVWVNRGATDWSVAGRTLPPYGFHARVPGEGGTVEAAIEIRSGLVVEWAHSPRQLYTNGRMLSDGPARIAPTAGMFRSTSGGGFAVAVTWQADDPIPAGYVPFFHFCDDAGEIVFQGGSDPLGTSRQGTIRTTVRGSVPPNTKPGSVFELRAGLYNPRGGARLSFDVPDDGTGRVRLGKLQVEDQGRIAWTPQLRPTARTITRKNVAGRPIDFGLLTCAGGVRLTHENRATIVTPLPAERGRAFEVRLRASSLPWSTSAPVSVEAISEDGRILRRDGVRRDGSTVILSCEPGTFQYRLVEGY